MVGEARARLAEPLQQGSSVDFEVGDAPTLDEQSSAYDKVVVIRVVINLSTWVRQVQALKEFARVLKVGGTLLLSEAPLQGGRRLNLLRQEWDPHPVPIPHFNITLHAVPVNYP